jgi:phenylpropionate dioxygenase-like ring-hydroxylating dioxygenase large terminal subunit
MIACGTAHVNTTSCRDYVLWADAAGQWSCFEDRCPHRLATLSDGLVDKTRGEIVCAYHGWRFQVMMLISSHWLRND